ncbi:VanZ family protein [Corynebacterium atypicum]|uniref:VanZ family protein n=1 Tax=Corynebacterium atypicum TaxID=191610 RepID=UPI002E20A132
MGKAALAGLGFSVLIETTQFVFGLGRSDIDDVIYNTCGAFLGGWIAGLGGRCWQRLLLVLTAVAVVVFVVLVALGDRLGDPALTARTPEEVAAVENALRDGGAADQAG